MHDRSTAPARKSTIGPSSMGTRAPISRSTADAGAPHREIFTGTAQSGQIIVSCACPMGADHTYEEGIKYRGPVDAERLR